MRYLVIAVGLLAAACGGGDDGADFDCSEPMPAGSYRLTYQTLDGDCGDIPAQTLVLAGDEALTAAGSSEDSCDSETTPISACEIAVETTCFSPDSTVDTVGTWNRTGVNTADGTFTFRVEVPGDSCTGTYAGSIRPQ